MNTELRAQMVAALKKLRRASPIMSDDDVGTWSQSRRVEGLLTTSGYRSGYQHVYCYMEKGLGGHLDATATILLDIIRYQRREGHSESRIFLAAFGGPNDAMTHFPGVAAVHRTRNALPLAGSLCNLAGKETIAPGESAVLKTLFPTNLLNYTGLGAPKASDMLVIFRSDRPIVMEKRLRTLFLGKFRKHTLWISFALEKIVVEMDLIPDEWAEAELANAGSADPHLIEVTPDLDRRH